MPPIFSHGPVAKCLVFFCLRLRQIYAYLLDRFEEETCSKSFLPYSLFW
jgi:hypothetical protein